ncbi:MAG: DUF362 domain-containing protein [candidate division Zixibacteria bacterium]|nr:DUF362 domain-containing protein [candidate division Zixibacteria bacterium]
MNEWLTSTVGIAEVSHDNPANLSTSIARLLEISGNPLSVLGPGQSVLIKPDLTCSPGGPHLKILRALVYVVAQTGATVYVGDSPWLVSESVQSVWRDLDLADLMAGAGATLVSFEKAELAPRVAEASVLYLPALLGEADLIINLGRLRRDRLAVLAGTMYNTLGCIPGYKPGQFPPEYDSVTAFNAVVVDVFAAVAPSFNLLQVGDENRDTARGGGFALLAGDDAVALETVAAPMVGASPDSIPAIRLAAESGLGIAWPEAIRVVQMGQAGRRRHRPYAAVRANWLNRPFVTRPFYRLRNRRPSLNTSRCGGCGRCVEVCPNRALALPEVPGPVLFREQLCVMCWHCHAVCERQAVSLRPPGGVWSWVGGADSAIR